VRHRRLPRGRLVGNARTRRKGDLDDLDRRREAARRDIAPDIATWSACRETGSVRSAGTSNSAARLISRAPATFSRVTAVALVSPRSISESIERLTPLFSASASRVIARSDRSLRTRAAICRSRVDSIIDHISNILDRMSNVMESCLLGPQGVTTR